MDQNERLLISKAKAGDVEAFEQLIEAYQKKVYNLALRMTGNQDDAADLAQEAFIRVFRSISGFKEQSSFSTWVYRITTNVCLDEIRKRKNRKVISIDEEIHMDDGEIKRQVISEEPLPDELAEREELRSIVNAAINSLPEDQRIVLTLRDLNGLSYDEIAKILDCPGGTVKSRINRARQALRNVLSARTELLIDDYVK
ncbi:MAG TPA: sigma-70 family RNA polymerase sigma factor [Clostridiales bacterium]|nr:sigma-70 family RNA polymerase sigma factor [Clostridiales bacterium]